MGKYVIYAEKTIFLFAQPILKCAFCCDHLNLVLKRLKGKQDVHNNGNDQALKITACSRFN